MEGMVTGGFVLDVEGEAPQEAGDDDQGEAPMEMSAGEEGEAAGENNGEEGQEKEHDPDRPKVDVIQMIRAAKAKAAAGKKDNEPKDQVAANDDFISFDFGEPEKEKESDEESIDDGRAGKKRRMNLEGDAEDVEVGDINANSNVDGSRPFSHREALHGAYVPRDEGPPGVEGYRTGDLPPPPGLAEKKEKKRKREADRRRRKSGDDLYDDYDSDEESDSDVDLGDLPQKRKRKHAEISRAGGKNCADGNVTAEWRVRDTTMNPTPWIAASGVDHSQSVDMMNWLVFAPCLLVSC